MSTDRLAGQTAAQSDLAGKATTQYRAVDGTGFELPIDPLHLNRALTLKALGIEAQTGDSPWEVLTF
jgi:hypothetical protein